MGPHGSDHNRWYRLCPSLPFSYCGNTIIILIFIVFLPLILLLGNLALILSYTTYYFPKKCVKRQKYRF